VELASISNLQSPILHFFKEAFMTISEPRLRSLLRQAERIKDAGKRAAAAQLYREITEEAPESAAAWLGLAELTADPAEREQIYQHVLQLEPDNVVAKAVLAGEPIPAPPVKVVPEVKPIITPTETPPVSSAVTERQTMGTAAYPPPPPQKPKRETAVVAEEAILYCYRHPERETALRCYNCNEPICITCANKTPVGYICPGCRHEMEEKFFTAGPLDYLIAGFISFLLSLLAGFIVVSIGRGFFLIMLVLFMGGAVGGFIAKLSNRVIGGRRGRYIPHLVAAMVVVGVAIPATPILLFILSGQPGALLALLVPGIYAFIAASAAFYWMR
jgi:hypothetical protein